MFRCRPAKYRTPDGKIQLILPAAQLHIALQNSQALERLSSGLKLAYAVQTAMIYREIFTFCQKVRPEPRNDINMRQCLGPARRRLQLRHIHGLVDMQLARLAVLPDTSIVINTVCRIGILLNLTNDDSFADRMKCSRINKEHIALVYRHAIADFQQRILFDALLNSSREIL